MIDIEKESVFISPGKTFRVRITKSWSLFKAGFSILRGRMAKIDYDASVKHEAWMLLDSDEFKTGLEKWMRTLRKG